MRYLLVFLIIFIEKLFAQDNFQLSLDYEIRSELKADQYEFYSIKPFENPKNNDILIHLRPLDEDNELNLYDPDLFVSTSNNHPNITNYEYASEKIGQDLIIIPARKFDLKTVNIGVYCKQFCKYSLLVQFEQNVSIFSNQPQTISNLNKDYMIFFSYYHFENKSEFLEFLSYTNSYSSSYKMRVYELYPDDKKIELPISPLMFGGYMVVLKKNSEFYCLGCYYRIELEAEKDVSEITLHIRTSNKLIRLGRNLPVLGITTPESRSCYVYNLQEQNKQENLIISNNLYTGNATLYIKPWSLPNEKSDFPIFYNLDDFEIIKLTPSNRNTAKQSSGDIFFCIYAEKTCSFYFDVFLESEIEKNQASNTLIAGLSSIGYLPRKNITSYKLKYFGQESSVSIALSFTSGIGTLYGYICEQRKCEFDSNMMRNKGYSLINANIFANEQLLQLGPYQNKCYKKDISTCSIFAVVICEGLTECVYHISYIHDQSQLMLYENTPINKYISNNKIEYYKLFLPNDKTIEKITIILTSHTGNAELYSSRTNEYPSKSNNLKNATNSIYSPDIIIYNKSDGNLTGFTYVSVFGDSDCYYSIHYYLTFIEKDMYSPVFIFNDHIVKDYFNSTENDFKLFVFPTKILNNYDRHSIIFSLTYETFEYDLFVYTNISNIFYNKNTNKMENYLWTSDLGQIYVKNTDHKFKPGSTYYVAVVLKDYYLHHDIRNTLGKFYIAAFFEGSQLLLEEGISHMLSLNERNNQSYIYFVKETSKDVFISLDTYYGEVMLYAHLYHINKISEAKYKSSGKTLQSIRIKSADLLKSHSHAIYIFVKNIISPSEYVISVDSSSDKPILFKKALTISYEVLPLENKYHYTTIHRNDTGLINIDFKHGRAKVKVEIISDSNELKKFQHEWTKPKINNTYLPIETNSIGYTVSLTSKNINRCDPCIILISVTGMELSFQESLIEYSISFVTSAVRILMNNPYKGRIGAKAINYYTLFFPLNISTLYIQLTNVVGDSDLIMNYGNILPSLDNYNWRSASSFTDIIDINNDDSFFRNKEIDSMQGIYTIGVVGYTESSYVLYATSHNTKIQYIRNDVSSSCMTKVDGDYCYFRFETEFSKDNLGMDVDIEYLLINTEYIYGEGIIYANIYNSTAGDVFEQLPSNTSNYVWSSKTLNRRDYLLIELNKAMLVKNHGYIDILIAVYCSKRCFLSITSATQYTNKDKFIEPGLENLIYMEPNKTITLKYTNSKRSEILLKTNVFMGDAVMDINEIKVSDQTTYRKTVKQYHLNERDNTQFLNYTPVFKYEKNDQSFIYTTINTNERSGFYLKIEDMTQIRKFNVGKANELFFMGYINNYNGYFEVLPEYEFINIILIPQSVLKETNDDITIFAKLKIVDKNKFYDNPKSDVANINDWDYSGSYDSISNKISFRLPGVKYNKENLSTNNKTLVAIYILTIKCNVLKLDYPIFDLNIIPQVNNIQRFNLLPGKSIYSSIELSPSYYHIYDISKFKSKNNIIEIQIAECSGKINFHLTNQIDYMDADNDLNKKSLVEYEKGTYKIILQDMNSISYLSISAQSATDDYYKCNFDFNKIYGCTGLVKAAIYMVYVNSYDRDNYYKYEPQDYGLITYEITGSDSVKLSWKKVIRKIISNTFSSEETIDSIFSVFLSDNEDDFKLMQSICSFSHSQTILKKASNLNELSYEISGLIRNKKYYINVLAFVKGYNTLSYIPIEIELKYNLSWIFYVLIFVVLSIICGVAIYFFRRFKRTSKLLEMETGIKTDAFVGNLSMTEMSSKRELRYGTLVEDVNVTNSGKEEDLDKN